MTFLSPTTCVLLALLLPLLGALGIRLCERSPNLREGVTLLTAGLLLAQVLQLLPPVLAGARPSVHLLDILPGLGLTFQVEPLGLLFALVASGLWLLTSVYSIGYMRGLQEHNQTRFYLFFALAICSTIGIAFAGNLLTLFVFYEMLTLSTYPLVAHHGDRHALRGGRVYLGMLLGTSFAFLLPAVLWTWVLAGTLDFVPGGIVAGKLAPALAPLLLAMYVYGIGKAALMPLHRWLPEAMVAPTPVSALLHAVAVVKAGVFTVLKVSVYTFGTDFLHTTGASIWLMYVAAASLVIASLIALGQDNLKARLAYSTVSQLAYVVVAAALASGAGILGGGLQIAAHALAKITLFFCAGAILVASGKTNVSEMDGLGRRMPVTFACFLIAALGIVGLPPLGGTWAKWYLIQGALDAQQLPIVLALLLSSLLSASYLVTVAARAFFLPAPSMGYAVGAQVNANAAHGEAPLACLIPIVLCAAGSVALFFGAGAVVRLLTPLTGS